MNDNIDKRKVKDYLSLIDYHLFGVKIKFVFYECQKSRVIFIHNFCAFILENLSKIFAVKSAYGLASEYQNIIVDPPDFSGIGNGRGKE